jgi:hypothetical protein
MTDERIASNWPQLLGTGTLAGAVINVIEWIAHRVWLDAQWNAAFGALGKSPSFWGTFVVANFAVGIISVFAYRWLSKFYRPGRATAIKAALAIWIIFWVIPIMGMQPFDIFPNYLLAMVIIVGIVDVIVGVLPALGLFDRMSRR